MEWYLTLPTAYRNKRTWEFVLQICSDHMCTDTEHQSMGKKVPVELKLLRKSPLHFSSAACEEAQDASTADLCCDFLTSQEDVTETFISE